MRWCFSRPKHWTANCFNILAILHQKATVRFFNLSFTQILYKTGLQIGHILLRHACKLASVHGAPFPMSFKEAFILSMKIWQIICSSSTWDRKNVKTVCSPLSLTKATPQIKKTQYLCHKVVPFTKAVDSHSYIADPAVYLNADPDPALQTAVWLFKFNGYITERKKLSRIDIK